jgi:hypothetical protein
MDKGSIYGNKLLFIVSSCFDVTDRELSINDVYIAVLLETAYEPIPLSEDNLKRRIRDKLNCLVSINKIEKIENKNKKNVKYFKYKKK